MSHFLTTYELSVARQIKTLSGFSYRIGLVFIDVSTGQQKRVTLNDRVWVRHIKERKDLVPDLSDSFLVGMLQEMLDWPHIQEFKEAELENPTVMVGHPQNKIRHANPTVARAIGLYRLAREQETFNVVSL